MSVGLNVRTPAARTISVASGAAATGTLPAFLFGNLASFVRQDIEFNQAELGIAVAGFFIASAIAAVPGGQLTERVGARATILGSLAVSAIACMGIVTTARSWLALLIWLVLAGFANGVIQPAGNLALVEGVPVERRGFAFGIKQAAIPSSTLLAGLAVPLIALTVGWRWAFVGTASLATVIACGFPSDRYRSSQPRPRRRLQSGELPRSKLILLALAVGLSAATATSLASFYVETAIAAGIDVGLAGALLVTGSGTVILVRLWVGWSVDRSEWNHLRLVAVMLGVGTVGFLGLGFMANTWVLVASTLLSFAAGWGWPGLFNFAVVSLNPSAPAAATSVTQTGVFIGGIVGPAIFGAVVESHGFQVAWVVAASFSVVAVVILWLMSRAVFRPEGVLPMEHRPATSNETGDRTTMAIRIHRALIRRLRSFEARNASTLSTKGVPEHEDI